MKQETTFYDELQNCEALDLRDNRGKHLNLALLLLELILSLLRNRDGNLSSIHRSMKNMHLKLCISLGIKDERIVSRSHLPIVLSKVNREAFEKLLFDNYGVRLNEEQKQWFSGDGKELRGSIEKGDKRGEVCVQIVSHEDRSVLGQSFYNGTKESEKPCLVDLVKTTQVHKQKFTADALHLHPKMTVPIHQAGGIFVIGLKDNQKELLSDMIGYTTRAKSIKDYQTVDKGHGRLEIRNYSCFDLAGEYFDKRWNASGFSSLIRVERLRTISKTNESSKEVSYYITNGKPTNAIEYFKAIRNHWSIEVNNHYRDVSLREDQLRTKKSPLLGS